MIEQVMPNEFEKFSEYLYGQVNGQLRPKEMDRIDYALLYLDDNRGVMGFITAQEHDRDTVYWQFGGAMPKLHGDFRVLKSYKEFIAWAHERYTKIRTYIENENIRYLKLALTCGFKIVGVRVTNGAIYVELINEKKEN